MKRMMIAAVAALMAAPAFADGPGGYTLRITASNGEMSESFEISFASDGGYTDSRGPSGAWEVHEGELCLTNHAFTTPAGQEVPSMTQCGPWEGAMQPGEAMDLNGWAPEGVTITVERVS
ncbi:MAG: hypothetical protein KIS81_00910 [Maricaulaceae bacterium]|nr:hypothetical protein [Maricaulaceae bacterium]